MLPFLPLHRLAAQHGDGLRPELLALLLEQRANRGDGLRAAIEPDETAPPCTIEAGMANLPTGEEYPAG